ncbi:hypothetical protein, partial [Aeromonas caviae]|uniref:hypothetical protein n=1 Tax=Aeromonas caviae TaxID=648 RepID=UPI0029DC5AAE
LIRTFLRKWRVYRWSIIKSAAVIVLIMMRLYVRKNGAAYMGENDVATWTAFLKNQRIDTFYVRSTI